MLKFFVILILILTSIIILTQKCAGMLCNGKRQKQIKRAVLYIDVLLIGGMVFAFTIGHGNFLVGLILHIAAMVFMGQIVFDGLILCFRLFKWFQRRAMSSPVDESRRSFLKGVSMLPIGAAVIALYGGLVEKNATVVRRFNVPVAGIPEDINGFTVVQLSDIHLGPFMNLEDLDSLMQKATELGINTIVPLTSDNCVVRYDAKKAKAKQDKWQKIANEAGKQCGRSQLPQVQEIQPLKQWLTEMSGQKTDFAICMCYENEEQTGIKELLNRCSQKRFAIVIGPEGGFSLAEAEFAQKLGIPSVSLGNRILRAETAAIAAMAIIQYEKGDLGGRM